MFTSSSIYSWLQGGAPSYKSVIHSMIHHISIVNPNPDFYLPTWQSFWGTSLYDSLKPAGRILIWRAEVSWSWQLVSLVLLTMLLGCWVLRKRRPWIHPGLARNGLQPWKSSKERIMRHTVTPNNKPSIGGWSIQPISDDFRMICWVYTIRQYLPKCTIWCVFRTMHLKAGYSCLPHLFFPGDHVMGSDI